MESPTAQKFRDLCHKLFGEWAEPALENVYRPLKDPTVVASVRPDDMFIRITVGAVDCLFATVEEDEWPLCAASVSVSAWLTVLLDDFADTVHPISEDLLDIAEPYLLTLDQSLTEDPRLAENDQLRSTFLGFKKVWDYNMFLLQKSPQFEQHKDTFLMEWKRWLDAQHCTRELNLLARGIPIANPKVLKVDRLQDFKLEDAVYHFSAGMHQTIVHTMVQMFSANWKPENSELAHHLGRLADECVRMGNSLWSGSKEIGQYGDFGGGMSAISMELGILNPDEIRAAYGDDGWDSDKLRHFAEQVEYTPVETFSFRGKTYTPDVVNTTLDKYGYVSPKDDVTVREVLIAIGYDLLEAIGDYIDANPVIHDFAPDFFNREKEMYEYQIRATATEMK